MPTARKQSVLVTIEVCLAGLACRHHKKRSSESPDEASAVTGFWGMAPHAAKGPKIVTGDARWGSELDDHFKSYVIQAG